MMLRFALLSSFAALAAVPAEAAERATPIRAAYDLKLMGLSVGAVDMTTAGGGSSYSTQIGVKLVGLASVFSSGQGHVSSSGSFAGGHVVPARFNVTTSGGKQPTSLSMNLSGGRVSQLSVTPERPVDNEKIPVTDAHKRGVIDPVSAGLISVPGHGPLLSASACNHTAPVFDGFTRFNLVFSYAGKEQVDVPGYSGEAIVCDVRFVPVAGHHPRREEELTARGAVSQVTLVPSEARRLLVPAKIVVPTKWGQGVLTATRLELGPQRQAGLQGEQDR